MEHFHHAGGLPTLMRELAAFLDLDAPNVSGRHAGRCHRRGRDVPGHNVIYSFAAPLKKQGAMAVLRGNLAPRRRGHQAFGGLAELSSP